MNSPNPHHQTAPTLLTTKIRLLKAWQKFFVDFFKAATIIIIKRLSLKTCFVEEKTVFAHKTSLIFLLVFLLLNIFGLTRMLDLFLVNPLS